MKMAEIGSFLGVSTEVFCLHFEHVWAIDIWGLNSKYGEANRSLSKTGLSWDQIKGRCESRLASYSNSTIIHNFSELAVSNFENNSLDFVYIDGNHGSAGQDVEIWLPKIRSGGYIGGHDLHLVRQLLKKVTSIDLSDVISFSDTSWLKRL